MPNHPPTSVDPPSLRVAPTSLIVLATLASVFMLSWASAVRVPLTPGLMLSRGWSRQRRASARSEKRVTNLHRAL